MTPQTTRFLKIVLGWVFLVLGVLGLFLPILQGVLFLAIGLTILAQEQPWAHRMLMRIRRRFPHMAKVFDQSRNKAEAWVHRVTRRRRAPSSDDPAP
ncbi:MAG: PGPGW domain-containing protein [Magnetospirillum sp.]|nr:PGPGW domain-containing protein [Magnetospirillum sp.]